MERIWQWAWDRYAVRYSWALGAISLPILLSIFLIPSLGVVALEESGRYVEAVAVTAVARWVWGCVFGITRHRLLHLVEQ